MDSILQDVRERQPQVPEVVLLLLKAGDEWRLAVYRFLWLRVFCKELCHMEEVVQLFSVFVCVVATVGMGMGNM